MSQATAGPWNIGEYSNNGHNVYGPTGTGPKVGWGNSEANARLIAAAPALLAALQAVVKGYDRMFCDDQDGSRADLDKAMDLVVPAIAQAEAGGTGA